jgi:hypothetical protein
VFCVGLGASSAAVAASSSGGSSGIGDGILLFMGFSMGVLGRESDWTSGIRLLDFGFSHFVLVGSSLGVEEKRPRPNLRLRDCEPLDLSLVMTFGERDHGSDIGDDGKEQ